MTKVESCCDIFLICEAGGRCWCQKSCKLVMESFFFRLLAFASRPYGEEWHHAILFRLLEFNCVIYFASIFTLFLFCYIVHKLFIRTCIIICDEGLSMCISLCFNPHPFCLSGFVLVSLFEQVPWSNLFPD